MNAGASRREIFLGVDVGSQGVRAVALDETGELVASARRAFPLSKGPEEQSPEAWWSAVLDALGEIGAELARERRFVPVALSVTSTSGTVVPLDRDDRPLHSALMYGDTRAAAEAEEIARFTPELGCNISWGLPKIVWFRAALPEKAAQVAVWRHAGDVILGRLTGVWDATDVTSALKSGYDPATERWPADLFDRLGLPEEWFPRVLPSGVVLGGLLPEVAAATGLPGAILVTTGMTDGCASQVAAGAVRPGDWNSTIGTTLVVKGVTRRRIVDPLGRVYSHRHPDGFWMPGGASNTGAEWIARDYAGEDLDRMEAAARGLISTGELAYPLRRQGERFPFVAAEARGFDPAGRDGPALFAARLEGVAYLERLALEMVAAMADEPVTGVFAAGGGSKSDLWLRIRTNVLGRPIHRALQAEAAAGAAIVAAAGTRFGSLAGAVATMVRVEMTIEPDDLVGAYDDGYRRFVAALRERGYLPAEA